MNADAFFEGLWADYVSIAPNVAKIKALFESRGEVIQNDHVAFRTFSLEPIGLESLELAIRSLGYEPIASHPFETKKLNARGYLYPDPSLPRIFLSELMVPALSRPAQDIIGKLVGQIDPRRIEGLEVFLAGRLWDPMPYKDYCLLREESEYAAWVAALGIRPNPFTLAVNHLHKTPTIQSVLDVVQTAGYIINESGGRVKGGPEALLEQGSTMADEMEVEFAQGEVYTIPTCYYEFAFRYPVQDGGLYQGFVAGNADKIFESTDSKPES